MTDKIKKVKLKYVGYIIFYLVIIHLAIIVQTQRVCNQMKTQTERFGTIEKTLKAIDERDERINPTPPYKHPHPF